MLLFAAALLAVLVSIIVWGPAEDSESREFEVLKVAVQAVAAATVGAAIAYAGFRAQQTYLLQRQREAEKLQEDRNKAADAQAIQRQEEAKKLQEAREEAADAQAVRRENLRRGTDRQLEDRRRQDEFVRDLLEQTLSSYHGVKRVRRMMEAEMTTADGAVVRLDVYDRYMRELNEHQLGFELLKRRVREVTAAGDQPHRATAILDAAEICRPRLLKVEKYLNAIVGEYQEQRHRVARDGPVPLKSLTKLHAFVKETRDFRTGASNDVDAIVITLQEALIAPVQLPEVT